MLKTPVFKMFLPISPLRRFAPAPPSVGEPWMVQQPYKLKFEIPFGFFDSLNGAFPGKLRFSLSTYLELVFIVPMTR